MFQHFDNSTKSTKCQTIKSPVLDIHTSNYNWEYFTNQFSCIVVSNWICRLYVNFSNLKCSDFSVFVLFVVLTLPQEDVLTEGSASPLPSDASSSASPHEQSLQAFLLPVVPHTGTTKFLKYLYITYSGVTTVELMGQSARSTGSWKTPELWALERIQWVTEW